MELRELLRDDHYNDLRSAEHPSVFIYKEDYQVLILRFIKFGDNEMLLESEGYVFRQGELYHFDRESEVFELVEQGIKKLSQRARQIFRKSAKIANYYVREIEALEEQLYERDTPQFFIDAWFDLKKDLTKLERYYQNILIVFRDLTKFPLLRDETIHGDFLDLKEDAGFVLSTIQAEGSKLDNLHHYYDSIKQDKLNRNIYFLTLVSGIFLPLNLIVGFFGMNTPGLFWADDPSATDKILWLFLSVILAVLLVFPLIRFVDSYLVKRFMGRYRFYERVSQRYK